MSRAREGVAQSNLRPSPAGAAGAGAFLCSNGGTSNFLRGLQTELGYDLAPMGGAGNKALCEGVRPDVPWRWRAARAIGGEWCAADDKEVERAIDAAHAFWRRKRRQPSGLTSP